jgi:hypothetical protein
MKLTLRLSAFALVASFAAASAQPVHWDTYSIPETGTSVDIPTSIFSKEAGHPDGYGERLKTSDGRAELTVLSMRNSGNDTPASFLAKLNPPTDIQYKRVTRRFVAVSGYKRDVVYYSRCNFSQGLIHCVMIDYPAREERDWDGIVTRISLSLSGKS